MRTASPALRDRVTGMIFIALAAVLFCIGALVFFDYLRSQSGVTHYLPAKETIAWLEVEEWRLELDAVLPQLFPASFQAARQKLSDYHDKQFGVILLAVASPEAPRAVAPVYYLRVNRSWDLNRYLGLDDNNAGKLAIGDVTYYLQRQRQALFLSEQRAALALLGPQTDSLSNDIGYQRLHNNLPRQSWGKIYYQAEGLWQQVLSALGYHDGDLVPQVIGPLLAKMGAVGARLDIAGQSLELTAIQSLPLEKLPAMAQKKTNFIGYLASFVPDSSPLLFINGENLLSYYRHVQEAVSLNEPLSAQLINLWARGISQRTGIDWQKDVLAHFSHEYGFVINLKPSSWEILLPLPDQTSAALLQEKLLSALKNIIPTLHSVMREVTLPDQTTGRWLVADPIYELLDYQSRHNDILVQGLRYAGQSQPSLMTAWHDGVLLIASSRQLLAASLTARQEKRSLAQSSHYKQLSEQAGRQPSPYIFGNLADLALDTKMAPQLAVFFNQFRYFLARQEILGFDVLLKASLSGTP